MSDHSVYTGQCFRCEASLPDLVELDVVLRAHAGAELSDRFWRFAFCSAECALYFVQSRTDSDIAAIKRAWGVDP